jgi:hypothetical protein
MTATLQKARTYRMFGDRALTNRTSLGSLVTRRRGVLEQFSLIQLPSTSNFGP